MLGRRLWQRERVNLLEFLFGIGKVMFRGAIKFYVAFFLHVLQRKKEKQK